MRVRSRNESSFEVHPQPESSETTFHGLEAEQLAIPMYSQFDIEFHLHQEDQALRGYVIYSPELYMRSTIKNMLLVFAEMLEHGLADPTSAISSLPLAGQ